MAVALLIAAGVCVFVIAAVTVGREARRLDSIAPRTVYQLDEAVDFVADRLPAISQARMTHDEVRALLVAHMQWLHAKGLQPAHIIDRPQDIDEPIVVEDTTAIGYLIGVADTEAIAVDDADLVNLTDAHLAYLDEIGAVGPVAADPDVSPLMLGRGAVTGSAETAAAAAAAASTAIGRHPGGNGD